MSPTVEHFRISDTGGVRTITIDRPEVKNALTTRMRDEFCAVLSETDADESVRVVVLTAVDPVFSAGVDFKDISASSTPESSVTKQNPAGALRAMRTPVIAAVNGACVSGALEIALSCSFVIASDRARFADTHARLGVVATWGLTALLPRAIGVRRARQMSITGDFIDAPTALAWGLVNEVVPHDSLLDRAHEIASHVAATAAVAEVLDLYDRGTDLSLSEAVELEAEAARNRTGFDPAAFSAAGQATARRQRRP